MEALYFITCLAVIGFVYVYPKSEDPLNGLEWVFFSIITLFCVTSFDSFFLVLIRLPANLLSMSLFNLFWIAALGWWMFQREKNAKMVLKSSAGKKKKNRQAPEHTGKYNFQKYQFCFRDIAAAVVLGLVTVCITIKFFHNPFEINYETVDPANHFKNALYVYNNSTFPDFFWMSFHFSNLGMILKTLAPVVSYFDFYKVFILFDIFVLYLSAMSFYFSVYRIAKNNISIIITLAFCILYMLGYPLNSMIFGFEYLSTVILLIVFSVILMNLFIQGQLKQTFLTALLFFVFMGIFNSYYMFVPVIYLSAFLCFLSFYRKRGIFKHECILTVSITLVLPAILGLLFYVVIPKLFSASMGMSAVGAEGYTYRELYADFVFFLPLSIYGIVNLIRSKSNSYSIRLILFLFVFMIICFIAEFRGKISSYYYYKNNYILWFLCCYFAVIGMNKLLESTKPMAYAYIGVWAGIILLLFTQAETAINSRNLLFDPVKRSENYFPVYTFNAAKIVNPSYAVSKDKLALYKKVRNYYLKTHKTVPLLSKGDEECLWYDDLTKAYTNTDGSNNYPDLKTRYNQWLSDSNSKYLVCVKQKETAEFVKKLSKYRIVFENDAGYIYSKIG